MVEAANSDKKNAEKQSQESQEIIKATQKEVERLKSALNAAKEKVWNVIIIMAVIRFRHTFPRSYYKLLLYFVILDH